MKQIAPAGHRLYTGQAHHVVLVGPRTLIFIALVVIAVALMLMLLPKRQGENVYPKMRYAGQDNTQITVPQRATSQATKSQ